MVECGLLPPPKARHFSIKNRPPNSTTCREWSPPPAARDMLVCHVPTCLIISQCCPALSIIVLHFESLSPTPQSTVFPHSASMRKREVHYDAFRPVCLQPDGHWTHCVTCPRDLRPLQRTIHDPIIHSSLERVGYSHPIVLDTAAVGPFHGPSTLPRHSYVGPILQHLTCLSHLFLLY